MRKLAVVLLGIATAFSGERGPQFRGMQTDAMGRSGTASIHSVSALYLNPAGLEGLEGKGIEASGEFGLNRQLLDYSNWISENSGTLNHFDSLLNHIGSVENKWASISNSYVLQGHYQDIAFSVVRDSRYDISLGKGAILPKLGAGILSDMQVAAGRGFALASDWNVGFTVKYIDRQRFEDRLLGENDDQFYVVKEDWQQSGNSLLDKLDKIEVGSEIAPHERGFGLNFGVNHPLSNELSIGASVLDLPTLLNGSLVDPQVNFGGAYTTDFGARSEMEDGKYSNVFHFNFLANLDWQIPLTRYHKLVDNGSWQFPIASSDPWFKQWKTGAGLETWVYNRQIAFVSAGLSDGYPSFGVRVGYVLYVYYVYTSEEIGTYPGEESLTFHKVGVELNF